MTREHIEMLEAPQIKRLHEIIDRFSALDSPDFSDRLGLLMAARHLSIAELADRAGIHYEQIRQYLNRGDTPSVDSLVKLVNALDCTMDFLEGK